MYLNDNINEKEVRPFQSFWMAGYECADHLNKFGYRVDLLTATGHLSQLEDDYHLLKQFNIRTVREGIRWSVVEKVPYQYDWSTVGMMMDVAKKCGIQQLWDICHFGFPDDITPLHPHFTPRFEALCRSFVHFYRSRGNTGLLYVTPINEVSFLSWLGGEVYGTSPFCVKQGWEVKYHLMRAYIRGVAAMKEMDAGVRIVTTEPLVHIVSPYEATPEQAALAARIREEQFQAVDMLCGRLCPELGGRMEYADILGFNFYFTNQWMLDIPGALPWAIIDRHPEWMPLRDLLTEAWLRYEKPVAITETSHPGEDRALWIEHIAEECAATIGRGIPLCGICLYPIIDRPDWDYLSVWHRSGLWDESVEVLEQPARILNEPYAASIINAQQLIATAMARESEIVL